MTFWGSVVEFCEGAKSFLSYSVMGVWPFGGCSLSKASAAGMPWVQGVKNTKVFWASALVSLSSPSLDSGVALSSDCFLAAAIEKVAVF